MTWTSFHNRGEILRSVIAAADARRDGLLPMDVEGVSETFGDQLTLLGALSLRWHTRLAGHIERELMHQPLDLESAVVTAWQQTAQELPGVRAVLDRHRAEPLDAAMAEAMAKATAKERILLAVMAGQVSSQDAAAARVGATLEDKARASFRPVHRIPADSPAGLLDRIKAALAA
ncbi:MAG: hypothetical protein JWO76_1816 [Nocardioides sp.]|nr:hypothetical protein [Nocardioides sp.]